MKKLTITLFSVCCLLSFSCQFSKGVKKDLKTGLFTTYNGFDLDDIYLIDEKGNRLNNNQIVLGSKMEVVASGVENYTEKDGKVFPGCTILLTDKAGKEILNLPNAFAELEGTTADEANLLKASLTTGDPMVVGETYHLYVRFFDSNKKESEIVAKVDLVMKE